MPAAATVCGDVHPGDAAAFSGEGIAGDLGGPGAKDGSVTGMQDVGVDGDGAEGQAVARPGGGWVRFGGQEPVGGGLEVVIGRMVLEGDPLDPLDAACADVAGDHHPDGAAVHGRKRLPVHCPGQEYLSGQRLRAGDRAVRA